MLCLAFVSDGELPVGLPHRARTRAAMSFISLNMACIHITNDKLLPESHLELKHFLHLQYKRLELHLGLELQLVHMLKVYFKYRHQLL